MDKRFYVIVPHYPGGFKKVGAFGKIFSPNQGNISVTNFEEEKKYLKRKTENTASGLRGVGVRAVQLNTQELIELYYGVYNPDISTTQKLVDISQLESEVIEKAPEEMEIG